MLPSSYAEAADPGLRSAMESIAMAWGLSLEANSGGPISSELQSITGDRLTVIHPSNPIWTGSPIQEPGRDGAKETLTPVTIDRSYAIATREVTLEQFLMYRPKHEYATDYAATLDCPAINVSWFDAAKYCRWLSEQEGIPESQMCYPREEDIRPGMRLRARLHRPYWISAADRSGMGIRVPRWRVIGPLVRIRSRSAPRPRLDGRQLRLSGASYCQAVAKRLRVVRHVG